VSHEACSVQFVYPKCDAIAYLTKLLSFFAVAQLPLKVEAFHDVSFIESYYNITHYVFCLAQLHFSGWIPLYVTPIASAIIREQGKNKRLLNIIVTPFTPQ